MAKATVPARVENLDQRLTRVEQILPTLATKQDLLATKEELYRAIDRATEPLATKEDIRGLATKEEIRGLATKEDISDLRRYMDIQTEAMTSHMEAVVEYVQLLAAKIPPK